jgi:hypothetical protein
MAAKFHRPLKNIEFNASGTWRRRYELSQKLQDLHINVAHLSETYTKPHEIFFIPNDHFYHTGRFPGRKVGTAVAVKKKRHTAQPCRPASACFKRSHRGLHTDW